MTTKKSRIWVMGASGLAGGGIVAELASRGYADVRTDRVDLTDAQAVRTRLSAIEPELIVLAAGYVGGIVANAAQQADFLLENSAIAINVMREARRARVRRLLYLGSSCAYPRHAPQPIQEDALMSGFLERTNAGYAVAKIAGIHGVLAVRIQDDLDWVAVMPSNLYGPGDNYDVQRAHVVAALIRKLHAAKIASNSNVRLLGTGMPLREFLYVGDFAAGIVTLIEQPGFPWGLINIGTGEDQRIADLARAVAEAVGYRGSISFDHTSPDGTPRKLLDVSRMRAIGWAPKVPLAEGLRRSYADFLERESDA